MARRSAGNAKESRQAANGIILGAMFPSRGGTHARPKELFVGRFAVDGALPWGGLTTYYRASTEGTPLILCVLPMDVSRSTRAEAAFGELAHGLGAPESQALPRVIDAGDASVLPGFNDAHNHMQAFGATLNEVAGVLKEAGARFVANIVLARGGRLHSWNTNNTNWSNEPCE